MARLKKDAAPAALPPAPPPTLASARLVDDRLGLANYDEVQQTLEFTLDAFIEQKLMGKQVDTVVKLCQAATANLTARERQVRGANSTQPGEPELTPATTPRPPAGPFQVFDSGRGRTVG